MTFCSGNCHCSHKHICADKLICTDSGHCWPVHSCMHVLISRHKTFALSVMLVAIMGSWTTLGSRRKKCLGMSSLCTKLPYLKSCMVRLDCLCMIQMVLQLILLDTEFAGLISCSSTFGNHLTTNSVSEEVWCAVKYYALPVLSCVLPVCWFVCAGLCLHVGSLFKMSLLSCYLSG